MFCFSSLALLSPVHPQSHCPGPGPLHRPPGRCPSFWTLFPSYLCSLFKSSPGRYPECPPRVPELVSFLPMVSRFLQDVSNFPPRPGLAPTCLSSFISYWFSALWPFPPYPRCFSHTELHAVPEDSCLLCLPPRGTDKPSWRPALSEQ